MLMEPNRRVLLESALAAGIALVAGAKGAQAESALVKSGNGQFDIEF